MHPIRLGTDALLVECADLAGAMALHAEALRRRTEGSLVVRDLVPAARTVLFDGLAEPDPAALAAEVAAWPLADHETDRGEPVELPTTYDGPDLAEVARQWDMTTTEVVATHTGADLVVAFCGFAPGFGYCTGLGRGVSRRESPRPSVPAGSVGLAGEFTGVYPQASPGGWQLVGHTDAVLWDADRDPPALLAPGTPVRFVRAEG